MDVFHSAGTVGIQSGTQQSGNWLYISKAQHCTGFRVVGNPAFDQLCTIDNESFGKISADYWSALHAHGGQSSFAAAKTSDGAFGQWCLAAANEFEAAGIKLYTADPDWRSLRATLCSDQPMAHKLFE